MGFIFAPSISDTLQSRKSRAICPCLSLPSVNPPLFLSYSPPRSISFPCCREVVCLWGLHTHGEVHVWLIQVCAHIWITDEWNHSRLALDVFIRWRRFCTPHTLSLHPLSFSILLHTFLALELCLESHICGKAKHCTLVQVGSDFLSAVTLRYHASHIKGHSFP